MWASILKGVMSAGRIAGALGSVFLFKKMYDTSVIRNHNRKQGNSSLWKKSKKY